MSTLHLISIGPGDLQLMTPAATQALQGVAVVIGYQGYLDQLNSLLRQDQEIIVSQLGSEIDRAEQAVQMARAGRSVAMVSSGDIGIYAMASPIFDVLRAQAWDGSQPEVVVHPGVSAIQATAAHLGAPLGHDFCTISLSDLLTPWPVIERRLQAAAWGDFVIGFYNPRSKQRDWQLDRAVEILRQHRPATTPIAIARNVTRPDEQIQVTTLAEFRTEVVDMFTLVLLGNSQSYAIGSGMATPRGYTNSAVPASHGDEVMLRPPHPTPLYPIALTHLVDSKAIVVGGGTVGERKVKNLLAADAQVQLISPQATPWLEQQTAAGALIWAKRAYQPGDLAGAMLVFAATDQRTVNAQVAQEAQVMGLLCNSADAPHEGNFHVPAVHRQGSTVVAVSTEAGKPKDAQQLRDQIATWMEE